MRRCFNFVALITFDILGQKLVTFFVVFLENFRLSKRHSEINWPLANSKISEFSPNPSWRRRQRPSRSWYFVLNAPSANAVSKFPSSVRSISSWEVTKKEKTTKKLVLRLEWSKCKHRQRVPIKRTKLFELEGDKKRKDHQETGTSSWILQVQTPSTSSHQAFETFRFGRWQKSKDHQEIGTSSWIL